MSGAACQIHRLGRFLRSDWIRKDAGHIDLRARNRDGQSALPASQGSALSLLPKEGGDSFAVFSSAAASLEKPKADSQATAECGVSVSRTLRKLARHRFGFDRAGCPVCHRSDRAAVRSRNRVAGKTNSVSSVALTKPPTTTVASGRWTSDPIPCASAAGSIPNAATVAVSRTARRRWVAPTEIASRQRHSGSPPVH